MRNIILCIIIIVTAIAFCPSEAARYGSRSSSSSRYSSRYSSYRSSSYRSSYRSYRYASNTRYRTSYRTSYRSYRYNTHMSSVGMGGLSINKQAMLIAGSVYVGYHMRPKIYSSTGIVISHNVDNYGICTGWVNWNTVYGNGSYAESDPSNVTATTAGNSYSNETATTMTPNTVVSYRYFLCPNNLLDGTFDGEDSYCCGEPGYQMCCSKEDFYEQMDEADSFGLSVGITFIALTAIGIVVLSFFCIRRKCRCRCRRPSLNLRRPAVFFRPVATAEPATDRNGSSTVKFVIEPAEPIAYPLYPPVNSGGGDQLPSHPPPPYEAL